MLEIPSVLSDRASSSADALESISGAFQSFGLVDGRHPNVTIFATGSLGRHEVGEYSDLDAFILDAAEGTDAQPRIGRLDTALLIADLIRAGEAARFPPFSRDGEFLHVHRLSALLDYLGKPDEDKLNVFTARMLLVLESQPLMGATSYRRCVDHVIDRYWVEAGHEDFKPTFLANDIVRYWKTLCLSYEGWRADPGREPTADGRIDLLKLKFNRVWLCFNGLGFLLLGDRSGNFTRAHAHRLVDLSPVDRCVEIAAAVSELEQLLQEALDLYAWWLDRAGVAKDDVRAWISNDAAYSEASTNARRFGDVMWELVSRLGERAGLKRYLLV